jgi:hypothetical protein
VTLLKEDILFDVAEWLLHAKFNKYIGPYGRYLILKLNTYTMKKIADTTEKLEVIK